MEEGYRELVGPPTGVKADHATEMLVELLLQALGGKRQSFGGKVAPGGGWDSAFARGRGGGDP